MPRIGRLDEYKPENEPWSAYIERVELFMIANGVDDERQVPTLLTAMGASTYGLLRNLVQPLKPRDKTFGEIVSILQAHFEPKQHVTAERCRFQRCIQKSNETVSQYVSELKQCASKCDFGATLDDTLRDHFVSGIQSEACRRRLRSEVSLTFKRAIEIALSMEAAERNALQQSKTTNSVATVHKHATHFQAKIDAGQFCRNGSFECPCCNFITKEKYSFNIHMDNHMSHAVEHEGFFILKCNKLCRTTAHFHCLYCSQTVIRKDQYIRHVSNCSLTEPSGPSPLPPPPSVAGILTSPPQITSVTKLLIFTSASCGPGTFAPPPTPPTPTPASPPTPPPPQKIQKKNDKVICPNCGLSLNRRNVKMHVLRRHTLRIKEEICPEPS